MDKTVIDQFWQQRSSQGTGRWTEPEMLDFEFDLLSPFVAPGCHILDLGSGPATLSLKLLGPSSTLTAVDKYPGFLDAIPADPRIRTRCCDIDEFDYPEIYDLILLFGVVTHLTHDEELDTYAKASRALSRTGVLAVKNQVSRAEEKLVDGYSESLKCHYVGRYPDILGQAARLGQIFNQVEIRSYPTHFDKWPDTTHTCFLCSGKR
jgi:hypothetical protein